MNFTPKQYATRNEKIVDFVLGFLGWYLVNGLLYTCSVMLLGQTNGDNWLVLTLLGLPLVLNIAALIVLARLRRWIALGALAAFAAMLVLVLILGILAYAVCFNSSFR
ncbi:MAG TPA: hypothetical protein PLO33_14960 [Kouleothrix sp.]|nr:hypothetical protein [Kouleothrix sp.]HRC76977.1 hypothetical protein [Kouleothrix sp.]